MSSRVVEGRIGGGKMEDEDGDDENRDKGTCLELALEGERLCKCGDFAGGIAFFEAAVKVSTKDMRTLSAIYSQLGNAYFYLTKYEKALHYHKLDLAIAKSMGDKVGEGKASGNLGNTLKMLGRFEEAVDHCTTHLELTRELKDQVGEGRALYNLGNIYYTKGKLLAKPAERDPGEFPNEVKECLLKAVHFYEENLSLMRQMGDKPAQGRACGNLGNTHYLLGNFNQAVVYHLERLKIAQEFNDKPAERRAFCNLGNAYVFLGQLEKAVENYRETLRLAQELGDKTIEAQACHNLRNSYALLERSRGTSNTTTMGNTGSTGAIRRNNNNSGGGEEKKQSEDFFEFLMKCQGTRLEDQRSNLPVTVDEPSASDEPVPNQPDEEFLSLLLRFQAGRMEDQRSTLPPPPVRRASHPVPSKNLTSTFKTRKGSSRSRK